MLVRAHCTLATSYMRLVRLVKHFSVSEIKSYLLASERSERDTIRGVQIRAGAVRICICNRPGRSEIRDKFHEC